MREQKLKIDSSSTMINIDQSNFALAEISPKSQNKKVPFTNNNE